VDSFAKISSSENEISGFVGENNGYKNKYLIFMI